MSIAALPWLSFKRFSLRTLLIASACVAVVLLLAMWSMPKVRTRMEAVIDFIPYVIHWLITTIIPVACGLTLVCFAHRIGKNAFHRCIAFACGVAILCVTAILHYIN